MSIAWTTPSGAPISALGTCTTGSESRPTSAADGLDLGAQGGVGLVSVFVESSDNSTNLSAGTIDFYLYNPVSTHWSYVYGLDGTISGGKPSYALPAIHVLPGGRLAAIPTGLGTAVKIWLNGFSTTNTGDI